MFRVDRLNFNFFKILGKVLAFIVNLYFFKATHTKEKTLMSTPLTNIFVRLLIDEMIL